MHSVAICLIFTLVSIFVIPEYKDCPSWVHISLWNLNICACICMGPCVCVLMCMCACVCAFVCICVHVVCSWWDEKKKVGSVHNKVSHVHLNRVSESFSDRLLCSIDKEPGVFDNTCQAHTMAMFNHCWEPCILAPCFYRLALAYVYSVV